MKVQPVNTRLPAKHTNPPLIQGNIYQQCNQYGILQGRHTIAIYASLLTSGVAPRFINCSSGEDWSVKNWHAYYQVVTNKYELRAIEEQS